MADQTDLDPELLASLELFNEHLERSATDQKAAKAVAKAERRKTEAANRVRKLNEDPNATAEAKAEAEAAYREAVAELAARTDDPLGTGATNPTGQDPEGVAESETGSAGSAGGEGEADDQRAESGSDSSAGGEETGGEGAAEGPDDDPGSDSPAGGEETGEEDTASDSSATGNEAGEETGGDNDAD